jgi:hypothetical protein
MERIAIDILGELPETDKGNRYIVVISEYYTKWTESHPMQNMKASTVAIKILATNICLSLRLDNFDLTREAIPIFPEPTLFTGNPT